MEKLFYKLYAEAWQEMKEKYDHGYGYYSGDYFFRFVTTFSEIVDEIKSIRCYISNYKENKAIATIEIPYEHLFVLQTTLEINYGFNRLDEIIKDTIQDGKNECLKITKQKITEYVKKTISDSIDECLKKIGTELESETEIDYSSYGDEDAEICVNLYRPEIGGLYINIEELLYDKHFKI